MPEELDNSKDLESSGKLLIGRARLEDVSREFQARNGVFGDVQRGRM